MTDQVGIVILAGGKGTRMKSDLPKALASVFGSTLIDCVIKSARNFLELQKDQLEGKIAVVTGHQRELLEAHLASCHPDIDMAFQRQQLGTADALKSYFEHTSWAKEMDYTLVLCADTPLLQGLDLNTLWASLSQEKASNAVAASFEASNPTGYGRIVRSQNGFKIVEEKDASDEVKKITEVNSGLYFLKTKYALEHLSSISSDNKAQEFYLTDLFMPNRNVQAVCFADSSPFMGVNSQAQREVAQKLLMQRKVRELQEQGVFIMDSNSLHIESDVRVSSEVTIFPNVYLMGETTIETGVVIEPGCIIKNSRVAQGVEVKANSYLENAVVGESASIGPFARLRPGSQIGKDCKIGNFVEVKKSTLKQGSKVSHLSYIGDATIGENSNIGCGFITCNYDGANKHQTIIGRDTFVGSDCQAVAPISIGDRAFIAAGSTITHNVPDEGFAIARSKQNTKESMAKRFLKSK